MIAFSTQISEVVPNVFVKVMMNSGRSKYGYVYDTEIKENSFALVSANKSDSIFPMDIEIIDTNMVVSIDPYLR